MSGAEINKLILAAMTTLLAVLLIDNVVSELAHKEPLEHAAYSVLGTDEPEPETPEPASQAAAPAAPSIAGLLASADPADGQKATKRCTACHTFDSGGANKVGPNLWGIVGSDKGSVDGFRYSNALKEAEGAWSYEDLNAFLTNPKEFLEGTKMNFGGFKSAEDRAAIIAYMRQQADNPLPLPGQ